MEKKDFKAHRGLFGGWSYKENVAGTFKDSEGDIVILGDNDCEVTITANFDFPHDKSNHPNLPNLQSGEILPALCTFNFEP